ncbi:MAG: RNA 2',3'-cyclic phosphodiesterase [Chloroflexi bacterium]|nr:RNA 2',3'-cyclic phosphodiesterase [Chloroflexota bacterium]
MSGEGRACRGEGREGPSDASRVGTRCGRPRGGAAVRHEPEARLFVAVPLPAETCATIEAVVDRVRGRLAAADADAAARGAQPGGRVRWVRMDGLHVTLRFLGGTAEDHVAALSRAVDAAAAGAAAFEVVMDGAGAFPNPSRPRSLWLAIVTGGEGFTDVARRLDDALAADGWPRDDRPFRPHLTLARTDGVRAAPLAAHELAGAAAGLDARFSADRIVLFRSHLGGGPARYEPLHGAILGKAIAGSPKAR